MRAKIVLLCEDRQTDSFVRRFLRGRNFDWRDIETVRFPNGEGSGEQWVRTCYPKELKAIRSRSGAYLVVVIDADRHSVEDRHSQLDRACADEGVPERTLDDRAIVIVPRRNIETWLAWLKDPTEAIDEGETYPRLGSHESHELANRLHRMCHEEQKLPDTAPPSLKRSCEEYRRLRR